MEAQRYPEDFDGYVIGAPLLERRAAWVECSYSDAPEVIHLDPAKG